MQCSYCRISHTQSKPTERVICVLAIREPCMSESAGRFGYPVQVLPNPSPTEQLFRARYARARNSRGLHGGKRWTIWISSAGTPLAVTRKTILQSALCASSQFASPAWRLALADLGIQCRYSLIRHPQCNPNERVMRDLAFRVPCMEERAGRFVYPVKILRYPPHEKQAYRAP
jgi:hypothetical protein